MIGKEKTCSLTGWKPSRPCCRNQKRPESLFNPRAWWEARHGFQEARAVAPRTVRNGTTLVGSGLALELYSRLSCAASRTLPLLQTNKWRDCLKSRGRVWATQGFQTGSYSYSRPSCLSQEGGGGEELFTQARPELRGQGGKERGEGCGDAPSQSRLWTSKDFCGLLGYCEFQARAALYLRGKWLSWRCGGECLCECWWTNGRSRSHRGHFNGVEWLLEKQC